MQFGRLDRRGMLYTNTQTVGEGGAVVDNLVPVRTLFLSQMPPSSRTIIAGARDAEQTEDVFTSRWFDGLRVGMVMDVEGHRYRIVRRDELGRREGYRIYGREVA